MILDATKAPEAVVWGQASACQYICVFGKDCFE